MSLVSLYDEASLWMTPSGVKDGKLFSELPVPEYGPEEVANGDFATDSDWTKESGWTISGGSANCLNGQGVSIYQTNVLDIGKYYKLTFTVSNYSQGFLGSIGNDFGGVVADTYGSYEIFGTATSTFFGFSAFGNFIGSIDNVSVKEVIKGDGDFTFSRGSNLAATRVGPTGLIEKGRENLLLQSNQFDTTWTAVGTTLTSGQSGYDGTNDAWLLSKDSGQYRRIIQNISFSGVYTLSVYAKANTLSQIILRDGTSSTSVRFDLSDGSLISSTGAIAYSIVSVGNGWYRCSVTMLNSVQAQIYVDWSQSNAGSIYIQDAQLEVGLAATDYIESGASTGKAGLLENEPRFDYSGGATCPSLLLEPQRVNLWPYSEYADDFEQVSSITIQTNNETSPEGLQNATTMITQVVLGRKEFVPKFLGYTSGLDYTASCFVKANGYNFAIIKFAGTGGAFGGEKVFFNLSSGQVATNSDNLVATIEAVGTTGWYRISATNQAIGTTTSGKIFYAIADSDNSDFFTGDGTSGVDFYGFQLEQGSYPTSYIPNHSGGSATRTADLTDRGANLSYTGNYTLFMKFNLTEDAAYILNATTLSAWSMYVEGSFAGFQFGRTGGDAGGVSFASSFDWSAAIGTNVKIALVKNGTSVAMFVNGTKYTPSANTLSTGNEVFDWRYLNYTTTTTRHKQNYINQLLEFEVALTDSECIALTTI